MPTAHKTRLVNPRLGTYFSIFASAFVSLFLIVLILEQLDAPVGQLRFVVLLGPFALFLGIAAAAWTTTSAEFFAAGRRVPAAYNGLVLALVAIGATGLVALPGLFMINGFDTWCIAIGIYGGFVLMGVAVSPFLRKHGAYSTPSYLARRFESRGLRVLAAMVFALPIFLLLIAELRMTVAAAGLLTGYDHKVLVFLICIVVAATAVLGGMRAVGWVGTAEAIAALIALFVLTGVLGVLETNLPLAQLSHGPALRDIGRLEEAQGLAVGTRSLFEFNLAGTALTPVAGPMATPSTSVGSGAFIATALVIMMGVAAAPWLLPRCTTTLGVYEARKTLGWAIFFAGVMILTLSTLAVFFRELVMNELIGRGSVQMPQWFDHLRKLGIVSIAAPAHELPLSSFLFSRDGLLYAVPTAFGFPAVMVYLVLAGAIAAGLAAATTTAFTLAVILAEDVLGGLKWEPATDLTRTHATRIMNLFVVLLALLACAVVKTDPLELFLSALALSAATAFPVILLSIWWKRLTVLGAAVSMITGAVIMIAFLSSAAGGVVMLPIPVAGLAATVAAFVAAIFVSLATPIPARHVLETARDMRVPGGETIYDREMRQHRFASRDND